MTHTPAFIRMVDAPEVGRIVMAKWADHVTGKAAEVVQLRRG